MEHEQYVAKSIAEILNSVGPRQEYLNQPIRDLVNRAGKRIRPVLGALIAACLDAEHKHHGLQEACYQVLATIEILHTASLVIDDIEDGSELRRELPCIHKKYGMRRALVSSNHTYFKVMALLLERIPLEMRTPFSEVYFEEMTLLHMGQAEDLSGHHLPFRNQQAFLASLPNEQQYVRTVVSKTGGLLRMMIRWLCILYQAGETLTQPLVAIADNLSICFQIRDDLINLESEMGKGVRGEDLLEQKITLMVIHACTQKKHEEFVRLFLKSRQAKTAQDVGDMIEMLSSNGSITHSQEVLEHYASTTMQVFDLLEPSKSVEKLREMVRTIVYRTH